MNYPELVKMLHVRAEQCTKKEILDLKQAKKQEEHYANNLLGDYRHAIAVYMMYYSESCPSRDELRQEIIAVGTTLGETITI